MPGFVASAVMKRVFLVLSSLATLISVTGLVTLLYFTVTRLEALSAKFWVSATMMPIGWP